MKYVYIILMLFVLSTAPVPADELDEPSWVYKGQGDRYFKMGELGKAIVAYKKALIKRRNHEDGYRTEAYPEVNLQLAKVYLQDGLYELAYVQAETAESNKAYLQIPDLIFDIKYTKAEILEKQKRNAEPVYREIIESDENWKYFVKQPYQSTILGKAIEDREQQKKYGKAHYELGRMKYNNGNYENALLFLEMALLYRYKPEAAIGYLIDCYRKLGRLTEAERALKMYNTMK